MAITGLTRRRKEITYFDWIVKTPTGLAAFLLTLKRMQEPPWETLFRKRICAFCENESCPFEVGEDPEQMNTCKYREDEEDTILWWLKQETEATVSARELMYDLAANAINRELSAQDEKTTALFRKAADTISRLLRELNSEG